MSRLNPAQQAAVDHGDGPLLVLAGAGSGKTSVITRRIARLVERGVDPATIVAVSFTNKAAREMAQRMVPLVGGRVARRLRMSTFHRFGLELLRESGPAGRGDGRFVVFDQADSLGLVRELLRERARSTAGRPLDAMAVLARISGWKSAMLEPPAVPAAACPYHTAARAVYPDYEARLHAMRALDFDDLVCRPVRLLRDDDELRARWHGRVRQLLVDEFQDTSAVQLELVKLLADGEANVCVVGDDDQSIYSWRGADLGNILDFERHFPGTRVVTLETNYRSRAPILDVANAVIAAGRARRRPKTLRAAREGGETVRLVTPDGPRDEARLVAREIRRLGRERPGWRSIAVLYRSNLQARPVEEELTAAGIAYRLHGGQQFFDRKEVKDVAAYLRVVVNPWDEISLRRVINYPARGVGPRSVAHVERHGAERGLPFVKAFERAPEIEALPDGARRSLARLRELLDAARRRLRDGDGLHAVAAELVEAIGLRRAIDDATPAPGAAEQRWSNVEHLLRWIERYEARARRTSKSLQEFLQRVTIDGDARDDDEAPGAGVTLSTLHAAKGLEFDAVFLVGCVEGQLPHTRSTDPKASEHASPDLDEERRLFYVGITRARERLVLSAPRRRMLRGKVVDLAPSRFLEDLPDSAIERRDAADDAPLALDELSLRIRALREAHHPDSTPP